MILLCNNTMHAVYDVLSSGLSVPVIHIADATADAIKKQGLQKVALLGTPFTMSQPFYKDRLKHLHGIDVIVPTEEQGQEIYRVINEELTFHILKREIPPLFSGCDRFFARSRRPGGNPWLYRNSPVDPTGAYGPASV